MSKEYVITGGSGGMGKETAKLLGIQGKVLIGRCRRRTLKGYSNRAITVWY